MKTFKWVDSPPNSQNRLKLNTSVVSLFHRSPNPQDFDDIIIELMIITVILTCVMLKNVEGMEVIVSFESMIIYIIEKLRESDT